MKQSSISSNNNHSLSRNSRLFSVRTSLDVFQSREEKLFGNKSFLEIILGLIKKTQSDVISISKEEKKKVLLHENLLNEKKRKMKEIIFNQNNSKSFLPDSCNETETNAQKEEFVNENGDMDQRKELAQLKMLNFKMENEINKIDYLHKRLLYEKEYIKNYYNEDKIRLDII